MDAVEELKALIESLVRDKDEVKTKVEEMTAQLAAYKEMSKKGFFFGPGGGIVGSDGKVVVGDDIKEFIGHYDLAKQGKGLQDKFVHPGHQISEEARVEMAKYFCLLIRATVGQDPRAMVKMIDTYGPMVSIDSKTALGDSGNAFPIPDIVDAEIFTFEREKSVVLQYGRVWDMISEKQSFPAETGAVSVAWGNETTESEPTISEVELSAEEMSAYSVVKNVTLMDARSDIVSWLASALAEAAGLELDNEGFNGDAGTDPAFVGILNANGAGYSVILGGSLFSDISSTKLSEMIKKLDGLKKQGARFFFHGEALHYVRDLKDNNGRPIFYETVGSPTPPIIYGYPYSEVIKMPSTSAANTAFGAFGNLRHLAIGRRLGSTALQVDPYGLWTTNRTRFKLYQRWALKISLRYGLVRMLTSA